MTKLLDEVALFIFCRFRIIWS